MSKREKVLLAVLGSILLHGVILLLLAFCAQMQPSALASRPEPIKLEIVPEAPTPTPPPPRLADELPPLPESTPPMIDTPERQRSEKPPEKPVAQSDKDTLAASEQPPVGDEPLPSQEGKKTPAFAFDTQRYTVGDAPGESAPAEAQPPQPPTPPQQTAPDRPAPDRAAARPTPAPTAAPTPEPTPDPTELAMLAPTPTPAPTPEKRATPPPDEPPPLDFTVRPLQTTPPRPQPVVANNARRNSIPGYQPQTERNYMSGGISNRGASALDALGTPLGRYRKAISDAIGSRWYMYVNDHADLPSIGTVTIHFTLDRFGKVRSPRVASKSGSESLASFSMQAILDAKLPPMPSEVYSVINSSQMELDFSFTLE